MNKAAVPLVMSTAQREALTVLSRSWTATRRQVKRATVLLMAADGAANSQIAATVGVTPVTLRSWRTRFAHEGSGQVLGGPRRSRPQAGALTGEGPGDRSPDSARKAFRGNALELLVDQEQVGHHHQRLQKAGHHHLVRCSQRPGWHDDRIVGGRAPPRGVPGVPAHGGQASAQRPCGSYDAGQPPPTDTRTCWPGSSSIPGSGCTTQRPSRLG
jgi:transposase-like protein